MKEIAAYVARCDMCCRVKALHMRPAGLLQPLSIPDWKWEDISMDFITGLPTTPKGHAEIVRLHGIPKTIVSDRGSQFTSHFWEHLHKGLGTSLIRSTAYHPQTDGQTERVNAVLEDMLRACVLSSRGSWESWLPLVEFAYNNSYQESIKMAHLKPCMAENVGHC
jgi:transposase InsO family protein